MMTLRTCCVAGVLAVGLMGCCGQGYRCDSTCQKRAPDLVNAVQAAGIAVHKAYHRRLPSDFDTRAYLAAARAYPLLDAQIEVLQSVDLEVWIKSDCQEAMVVARCRDTQRVILIDDTASTSVVDQPDALADPAVKVPARPDPRPTCPLPTNP